MGIKDLLATLKPALKDTQAWDLRGKTAVIDVMVWLYKGAYSCSYELALGKPTMNFLSYPVKMLCMLKSKGIKPICVFDGFHLLAKAQTEENRCDYKTKNRNLGIIAYDSGNDLEARKYFRRSLVLKSRMIDLFMDILIELNIEFVVAPYEADA